MYADEVSAFKRWGGSRRGKRRTSGNNSFNGHGWIRAGFVVTIDEGWEK